MSWDKSSSLSLGIFLSDDKAFSLNFTSMVEVTDCLSSFCISLSTSAALSPMTSSFLLVILLRMTQATACLNHGQEDYSPQALWEQVQQLRHLFLFMFLQDLFGVDNASWHLPPCTGWYLHNSLVFAHSTCGQNYHSSLNPPSDLAAFTILCLMQMSHQVPDQSWQE